jgi:hypothetical protein
MLSIDKDSLTTDLIELVGLENVIIDEIALKEYGLDRYQTEHTPLLVIKPSDPLQFKRINFIMRRYKINSINPRGYGFGINSGAYSEGLTIDLTLLNKKLEVNPQDSIVTAQAGFNYSELQNKLMEYGFRLPIEPILKGTLGGFIASGGIGYGSFRYGSILNILRSTTLLLSNGQIIQTGMQYVPPYSSGYNLNGLICGSEGYFGIITEAILEIVPVPQESLNLLFSLGLSVEISQVLTKLTQFSTVFNICVYKSILNSNTENTLISLRLEGFSETLNADKTSIEKIEDITFLDTDTANKVWENRILDSSQIPDSSAIIETIIPLTFLSQFFTFWEPFDSPPVFGILMNAGTILVYVFLLKELSESRKNEILAEFVNKAQEFQAYPPTIGNSLKAFVENCYPNLDIVKELKPVFDKDAILKSQELAF